MAETLLFYCFSPAEAETSLATLYAADSISNPAFSMQYSRLAGRLHNENIAVTPWL